MEQAHNSEPKICETTLCHRAKKAIEENIAGSKEQAKPEAFVLKSGCITYGDDSGPSTLPKEPISDKSESKSHSPTPVRLNFAPAVFEQAHVSLARDLKSKLYSILEDACDALVSHSISAADSTELDLQEIKASVYELFPGLLKNLAIASGSNAVLNWEDSNSKSHSPTPVKLNFTPAVTDILPTVYENAHISLERDSKSKLCSILENACEALLFHSISATDSTELDLKEIKASVYELFPGSLKDLAVASGSNAILNWEDINAKSHSPTHVKLNIAPAVTDILPANFENAHISLTRDLKSELCNILEDACDALISHSISTADSTELDLKEIKASVNELFPGLLKDLAVASGSNTVLTWEDSNVKSHSPTLVKFNFAPAVTDILPAVSENAHISLARDSKNKLCNILEDACEVLLSHSITVADSMELDLKEIKASVYKLFPGLLKDLAVASGSNVVLTWEDSNDKSHSPTSVKLNFTPTVTDILPTIFAKAHISFEKDSKRKLFSILEDACDALVSHSISAADSTVLDLTEIKASVYELFPGLMKDLAAASGSNTILNLEDINAKSHSPTPVKLNFTPTVTDILPANFEIAHISLARDSKSKLYNILEDACEALLSHGITAADSTELDLKEIKAFVYKLFPGLLKDLAVACGSNIVLAWKDSNAKVPLE